MSGNRKKIFIRSGINPFDDFSISHCISEDVYGSNTGNLLYAHSIYRALMVDSDVVFEPNYYKIDLERAEEINETCSYFIIPLADAFRRDFVYELRNLTEMVKRLAIPCVVTGVGLRAPYDPDFSVPFSFDDDVRDFVNAILDKSSMLGLRGELTAAYLKKLGYREEIDFTVIGCPSMYFKGAELSLKEQKITEQSKVCVNSSVRIPHEINDFIMENRKRFADAYFIPQQTAELRLAYVGSPYVGGVKYGNYPARITDPLFAEDRYKAFLDVKSWLDFLAEADFSFGGRLHGNIAAALAGIPNLMITSDARMRELSEYHGLAHVSFEDIKQNKDIFDLIEKADFKQVLKKQKPNFEHFTEFLRINGLDNIYARGLEKDAPFDQVMAKTDRKKSFKNYALCNNEEKLERTDSFFEDFNRVYDRCSDGYKEMFGIHENDMRNMETLKTERAALTTALEGYHRKNAISHVVIDTDFFSEKDIDVLLGRVEDCFSFGSRRVVHLLIDQRRQAFMRSMQYHKSEYPDLMLEEDSNPDVLRTILFPYYYFEENTVFWERLFAMPEVPDCVYRAFLADIIWKISNNVMWPYHYSERQLQQAQDRICQLIDQVPDEVLLSYEGMDNFQRYYLLGLKKNGHTEVAVKPEALQILRNGRVVYEAKKMEIILTKFRPSGKKIQFVAFIKSPVFSFCEKPVLYMEKNGEGQEHWEEIPLKKSSWCSYGTKEEISTFYTFVLSINTSMIQQFHFYVKVRETIFDTYFYFMPEVVFNTQLKRYRYYQGKKEYRFYRNTFLVGKAKRAAAEGYRNRIEEQFTEKEPEICIFRAQIWEKRQEKKKIWLYYDCKGVYKDNGYLQFVHDFEKEDGVERYYILNNDLEECKELFTEKQLPFVIPFGSGIHKMLYCIADKIITAYIEKNNYLPFTDAEYAKVMDVATMPMLVYLQHGVYHAHIPWKYALDRLQVDKKVISAKFEREQDLNTHCFTKAYELPVCMPRYDFLDDGVKPEKKILFAPSWRKYLVDMVNKEWVTREDIFTDSKFYRETNAFLHNEKLLRILKEQGYTLEFKLHPILMRYSSLYQLDGEIVKMAPSEVREEDYAIFITDFSSYVFDFAYLNRAILYFFADYEEFCSGMSDYRQCVLPFKDGIGEFADNAEDAVRILKKMIRRGGRPGCRQRKNMADMFYYKDNGARDRIYDALSSSR